MGQNGTHLETEFVARITSSLVAGPKTEFSMMMMKKKAAMCYAMLP